MVAGSAAPRAGHEHATPPGGCQARQYHSSVSTTLTAAPGWRDRRLLLRVLVLISGLVALKSFFLDPLSGHFGGTFEDFSAYMGAARSMAAGGSP